MAVPEQATINHAGIIQADVRTPVYGDSVSNPLAFQASFNRQLLRSMPDFLALKYIPVFISQPFEFNALTGAERGVKTECTMTGADSKCSRAHTTFL